MGLDSVQTLLHRGQFIIGPRQINFHPECKFRELGSGIWISFHPTGKLEWFTSKDGKPCFLMGTAINSSEYSAGEDIINSSKTDIPMQYRNWCGRWALIIDGTVHLDASGLLSFFYCRDSSSACWLSSSPALLSQWVLPSAQPMTKTVRHQGKIDWIAGPLTRFSDIRRLLPSQTINVESGVIESRLLTQALVISRENRLKLLKSMLLQSCRNIARHCSGTIWLPLTGGMDSRLILAACTAAGLNFTAYTQHYPFMDPGDVTLPPILAGSVGREHRYIRPLTRDKGLLTLLDCHTSGHTFDQDRDFFARQQWSFAAAHDFVLRGSVFEIGRCYSWKLFAQTDGVSVPPPERICALAGARSAFTRKAISEWHGWTLQTREDSMDWRDRWYVEQRLGCWMSSIEQALDLTGTIRVPLANSHLFRDLVLGFDPESRKKGTHQIELIEQLCPSLLQFPINPKASLGVRIGNRFLHEWRKFGLQA